ncbi:hypothetical protein BCR33DRAFT_160740 [Rhizoclosmatium globosum]|uniref:Uncharacterized protein n=1 Tax=Rhizoclosmatium globosum TaxID=329046 RepID=A0A1Y2CII0_9FUNG|nr:hypothetical protein BCR33DRAFT_160740 [Rhizoclosmatium globosum]|eukprot:ORY46115.1 hypothetical protein BCR33DRAFT_160740 [Rhizoclosmatium globosum]
MSQTIDTDYSILSFQLVLSGIYAFQLVGHISFIFFCETPIPRAFIRPFNLLLYAMNISLLIVCVSFYFKYGYMFAFMTDMAEGNYENWSEERYNNMQRCIQNTNIVSAFANTMFEVCYICAGWERSTSVIKRQYPRQFHCIRVGLYIGCALYFVPSFIQTVAPIVQTNMQDGLYYLLLGDKLRLAVFAVAGVFDVFLLVSFIRFLQKTKAIFTIRLIRSLVLLRK